jgi:transposase-like protein
VRVAVEALVEAEVTEEIGGAKGERETQLSHSSSYYRSSLIIRVGTLW